MAELIEVQQLLKKIDRPNQWVEKRAGIPQGTISQFLNGRRDFPEKHLNSLKKMAGMVDIIDQLIQTDFDFAKWMEDVNNRLLALETAIKSGEIHTSIRVYPVTPSEAVPVKNEDAKNSIPEEKREVPKTVKNGPSNSFLEMRRRKLFGEKPE